VNEPATARASVLRRILSSSSLIGGSTLAAMAIGAVRMKAFAVLLGPVGVGIIGTLSAVVQGATMLGGLGISSSIVREIGTHADDPWRTADVRHAFWSLTFVLAVVATGTLALGARTIGAIAGVDPTLTDGLRWLSLAVGLGVIAASLNAELLALGRLAALARVQVFGASISAVLGIVAVVRLATAGIVPALIAVPGAGIAIAIIARAGLPTTILAKPPTRDHVRRWRVLVTLGATLTFTALLGTLTQLVVRALVLRQLGAASAGLFQAIWAISSINLGLVLTAMAADYYPRLSRMASDRAATGELVNQQLGVALRLAAPLLTGMIALAPFVLRLFYSGAFTGAAETFRWQLAGDVLKIVGWALGYVLIVRSDTRSYLVAEASFTVVFIALVALLLPIIGLRATGIGYAVAYLVYVVLMLGLCARHHAITLSSENMRLCGGLALASLLLAVAFVWSTMLAVVLSAVIVGGAMLLALRFVIPLLPPSFTRWPMRDGR